MRLSRVLGIVALIAAPWVAAGCPDDEVKPGVDATGADALADAEDTTGADVTPLPALGVVRAWSKDGSWVKVRFDAPVDAASATAGAFALAAPNDAEGTITAVAVAGEVVTLTVDPPLSSATPFGLSVVGVVGASGEALGGGRWDGPVLGTVYLNLVWHQHQPSYLDPAKDELQGPWVRKHATKDYFDMTAMVAAYPKVHFNVNLTSSLLNQLDLYLERLAPFVNVVDNSVDEAGFLAAWAGKTDPWVDLLLRDTPTPAAATATERGRFYADVWSCKSIAEPLRSFFPEYVALLAKDSATYTQLDLALLKVWFEVAWMDPDFLRGPVTVYRDGAQDVVVDLSDVATPLNDGTFVLASRFTDAAVAESERLARLEGLANRLVAENFKIMKGAIEVHKTLGWTGTSGQVEVLTTPFFHPILPLLFNTDLAREGQPVDTLPTPSFAYPQDAELQIAMAVESYTRRFGRAPRGMWPSEGSVAEEIVPAFRASGLDWIATDRQVLAKGKPEASHLQPYQVDVDTVVGDGGDPSDALMIVFRDTELSDKVGFFYQSNPPVENAEDFVLEVLGAAGLWGSPRRTLSVILDGENAWEWYTKDHDAKRFLAAAYEGLEAAYDEGSVITVTGSELIDGNASRGVEAHPVAGLEEYEDLFPASWIGGRLDTWIGEVEENLGWTYLKVARDDIEAARAVLEPLIGMPASYLDPPDDGNPIAMPWWQAWRAMLSAEGSDWFWWYGSDQTSAGGDDSPFDTIYRAQLAAMYTFLNEALVAAGQPPIDVPSFPPILQPEPALMTGPFTSLPVLDGKLQPDESEWTPPGGVFFDNDTVGAIDDPRDDIARVFYGYHTFQNGRWFIGIDLNEDLSAKLGTDYQLVIYTSHQNATGTGAGLTVTGDPFNATTAEGQTIAFASGGPARRIAIDFSGTAPAVSLKKADGAGGWTAMTHTINVGGPAAGGSLLELRVLLPELGMGLGDPLEMAIVAGEGGVALDTAPNFGAQVVFADPSKLVEVILELDVTGGTIPLSSYVSIQDPPPPLGTGEPSVVGKQDEFANWSPNKVFLKDDGVAPDTAAGDGLYTLGFTFQPGTDLQYKYTIGHLGDSWGGTEEYPLTNRGYVIPAAGVKRVRVRDIFADRPDPSGAMAPATVVTVEE